MAQGTQTDTGTGTVSRVWHNFGALVTGRVTSAALNLAATACMARALGPSEFGLVVLLHTYVLAMRALLNCNPADTFVKYGVPLLDGGHREEVDALLGVVRLGDRLVMVLTTVVAVAAGPFTARALGLSEATQGVFMIYSLVLVASGVGASRGFVRATDRFDVLRTQLAIGPAVRLTGVLVAWACQASWQFFAVAWGASLAVTYLYLDWRGRCLMSEAGYRPARAGWHDMARRFPGLPAFVATAWGQGLLDQLPRQLIVLLIGGMLGPAAAGLYRIAREVADVLAKPVLLIRQAAFTEITRLGHYEPAALRKVFGRYSVRLAPPAIALLALVAWIRTPLLEAIGGQGYAAAGTLLVLMLAAAAVELTGAVLRPTAWVMGRAMGALKVQVVATLVYFAIFIGLTPVLGIDAAGYAAVASAVCSLVLLATLVLLVWSRGTAASAPTDEGQEAPAVRRPSEGPP